MAGDLLRCGISLQPMTAVGQRHRGPFGKALIMPWLSLATGLNRHRLIAGSTMESEQFGQRSEARDNADKLHGLITPRT